MLQWMMRGILLIVFGAGISAHAEDKKSAKFVDPVKSMMIIKSYERDISFYGKVIDQNSSGVQDALIRIHCRQFIPIPPLFTHEKNIYRKTDKEGLFKIENISGRQLYIDRIEKNGYEFVFDGSAPKGYDFNELIVNPDKPNIFRMRKIGVQVFLLYHNTSRISVPLVESGAFTEFDLVEDGVINENTRGAWVNKEPICDLTMHAAYDTSTKNWIITLTPSGENSGIILSDKNLYEAPEGNYAPNYKIATRDNKIPDEKWKYIYLRFRTPIIYSKLKMNLFSLHDKEVKLWFECYINPYGDRNFEPIKNIEFKVEEKLREEARDALAAGRYPERRDIDQLTRELAR